MSMEAYRWALSWNALSTNEKFVLVLIADHYNEKAKRSWPSVNRLAETACMHRSSVIRAVKGLVSEGLVQVEPWVRADTKTPLTNRYCLPLYDAASVPSKRLPVEADKSFAKTGTVAYDTSFHNIVNGEDVPGYAA